MRSKRFGFLPKRREKEIAKQYELSQVQVHKPKRLSSIRREADEVKDVLQDNLVKLRDRQGKLEDLMEKGETLEREAEQFQMVAKKVHRKMWCRSKKFTIALIMIGILVVVVVGVVITLYATGVISTDTSQGT